VLGKVRPLSEPEQITYYACEEVIANGWNNFLQVGLALAQIRDQELYRTEYDSFEAYCRIKWQYGKRYANYLISAAQVFTCLGTFSSQIKPQHETQVRVLVGLPAEQVKAAWVRAVEQAGGRKVTAAMVKAAIAELDPSAPRVSKAASRPSLTQTRQLVDAANGELLVLTSQNANHNLLSQKLEALHAHIHALFSRSAKK
jgi:hypothetical protein